MVGSEAVHHVWSCWVAFSLLSVLVSHLGAIHCIVVACFLHDRARLTASGTPPPPLFIQKLEGHRGESLMWSGIGLPCISNRKMIELTEMNVWKSTQSWVKRI